jgi:hypothetical protein
MYSIRHLDREPKEEQTQIRYKKEEHLGPLLEQTKSSSHVRLECTDDSSILELI